jgi:uncharacterized membrane-anchored protein
MRKAVRENLIFIVIAHMCWLMEPALVFAQEGNYHPENFIEPVNVVRGKLFPAGLDGTDGVYLNHGETCTYVQKEFGWQADDCPHIEVLLGTPTPIIDSLLVYKPISDGYVSLDDWEGDNVSEQVDEITQSYKSSIVEQSKALGRKIEFGGWRLYPTVDKTKNIMYYASTSIWDGEPSLNVTVSIFDRSGYIKMAVVPLDAATDTDGIRKVVLQAVDLYKPNLGSSYAEFTSGDKVAAYGAVGVFATLLGVKYGKAAAAGFMAIALVLLKKAWFLLLLPFMLLGKLFSSKKTDV